VRARRPAKRFILGVALTESSSAQAWLVVVLRSRLRAAALSLRIGSSSALLAASSIQA